MGRLAIFGGSFNPVHKGHLDMAKAVHDDLGYDTVLFVPAARSPFKEDAVGVTAFDRYFMLCLAVKDMPYAQVSALELARPSPSYTIDTVRLVKESIGPDDRLGLVIGTDQVNRLQEWKDWESILELTRLIVFQRPGCLRSPAAENYHCTYLIHNVYDTSSTAIREDVFNRLQDVSPEVGSYIIKEGLYRK